MHLPLKAELLWGGLSCLVLSLLAIRWVAPLGWMDAPDERKRHLTPTPLTGGLALWAALVVGQLMGWIQLPLHREEWIAVHGMALMGALDDRFGLRARYKALVGLMIALVLGWHAAQDLLTHGVMVHVAKLDLPNRITYTFPLAVLWFWGIPQAFNLIDGMDGLALGLTALLLGILGFGATSGGAFLMGGVLVVLLLNYPRARHFLGDSGAFLLGTLLAILALKRGLPAHPNLALWAFAYPIVDVTLVVAIRLALRRSLAEADHNHLHDWMIRRLGGLKHAGVLATPLLLLVALGPMLHFQSWPHAQEAGLAGLALLFAVAIAQFRHAYRAAVPDRRRGETASRIVDGPGLPMDT